MNSFHKRHNAPSELAFAAGAIFIAALVRGFAGFALSALIMASLAIIIPPVQLIPVCFLLEATASLMMFRGGIKNADMSIVWGLAIFSAIGAPIGLSLTTTIPVETSKLVALCLLIGLASLQLFKVRMAFLATRPGLYLSGLTAGIATVLLPSAAWSWRSMCSHRTKRQKTCAALSSCICSLACSCRRSISSGSRC